MPKTVDPCENPATPHQNGTVLTANRLVNVLQTKSREASLHSYNLAPEDLSIRSRLTAVIRFFYTLLPRDSLDERMDEFLKALILRTNRIGADFHGG